MLAKYARKENATDKILRNHLEVKWCLLKCISGCKFLENLLVDKTFVKLSRRRFMSSVWLKRNLNNTRQITMCSYFCKVT
jgi:AraC-like DNA-binding protein